LWEKDLGSIEPGKLADFVIWADPIDRIPPRDLPRARVGATFVNGLPAYRA
jgi:predicted amidohydrolase YtcJ